jgi:hypothetical protein
MSAVRKVIFAVYTFLFLSAGFWLIFTSRRGVEVVSRFKEEWIRRIDPETLAAAGAAFFLAGLIPLVLKVAEMKRSRYVAFENPRGEVAIRLGTVEKFIRRVVSDFREVVRAKTAIIPHRRSGVEIILDLVLNEGANIPSLTEGMQKKVSAQLNELLGIENIFRVQINVVNIKALQQREE